MSDTSISIAPLTLFRPDPLDLIEAAGAAGFNLVDLQFGVQDQPLDPRYVDPGFVGQIRTALRSQGLEVLDVGSIALSPDLDPAVPGALVRFASEVGARIVHITDWDPEPERTIDRFGEICDLAVEPGLQVAIEFMPYSYTRTLDDASALIAAVRRGNAGIVLDTLHLMRSGGSPAAIRNVPPAMLSFIQLADAPRHAPPAGRLREEALGGRLLPGEGELPLDDIFDALPAIPVSVEVPSDANRHLALVEQARLALDSTTRFLARVAEATTKGGSHA
jgi:sugar phosphate isomerase/epimerase